MDIKEAGSKEDFLKCWEAINYLYPQLSGDQDRYLTLMLYMIDEGYKMNYIEVDGKGVSVCGYRKMTGLTSGRFLFIDHLVTLPPCRNRGFATALLSNLKKMASDEDLSSIEIHLPHGYHEGLRRLVALDFRISAQNLSLPSLTSLPPGESGN